MSSPHEGRRQWTEGWRRAVHSLPVPAGLIDLDTHRVLELSAQAVQLLALPPGSGSGIDYFDLAENREDAAATIQLVRAGRIDWLRARRQLRRPDGTTTELRSWAWAIRSKHRPDLGLWIASDPPVESAGARFDGVPDGEIALDAMWRPTPDSAVEHLLGHGFGDQMARPFLDFVHPDDRVGAVVSFARATFEPSVETRVRISHQQYGWYDVLLRPTFQESGGSVQYRCFFEAHRIPGQDGLGSRLERIESHLEEIASQLRSADSREGLGSIEDGVGGHAWLADMTPRQREILSRLTRGQRVPAIASALYLSPSTVRNHLTAIFRKVGVHSQQELLAVVRLDLP